MIIVIIKTPYYLLISLQRRLSMKASVTLSLSLSLSSSLYFTVYLSLYYTLSLSLYCTLSLSLYCTLSLSLLSAVSHHPCSLFWFLQVAFRHMAAIKMLSTPEGKIFSTLFYSILCFILLDDQMKDPSLH